MCLRQHQTIFVFPGYVFQSVFLPAACADKEIPGLIKIRLNGAEHNLEAAMNTFPHDATPISDAAFRIADRASLELIESEFHHDSPWTFYAPWTLLDDAVIEEAVAYLCARGLAERTDSDDLVTVYIKETES